MFPFLNKCYLSLYFTSIYSSIRRTGNRHTLSGINRLIFSRLRKVWKKIRIGLGIICNKEYNDAKIRKLNLDIFRPKWYYNHGFDEIY